MEVWYTSAVLARCTLTIGKTVITARENVGRFAKGIKGHMEKKRRIWEAGVGRKLEKPRQATFAVGSRT